HISDEWEKAGMYIHRKIAAFDSNWSVMPARHSHLSNFEGWFDTLTTAEKAGAAFTFYFDGDMFGIFDIGGPEVGQLAIWVDDQRVALAPLNDHTHRLYQASESGEKNLNRFNGFCNNRYRGQFDVVQLPYGRHKVTLEISSDKADKRAILGPDKLADISANPSKYDR